VTQLVQGTQLGSFRIEALVGAGGMGEVYRAQDTRLNRRVALKILPTQFAANPDRLARFEREAQALASLNHSRIAQIYGLEEFGALHALVMEFVDGHTLAERLAVVPPRSIPADQALLIARQIAEALDAAHEKGIVHRDLKPANVMLTSDSQVKVLDFGLAKLAGDESTNFDQTHSPTILTVAGTVEGVLLGTVPYMSPEQARGRLVDKRSDNWAFGCVLYEMFTGRAAFRGDTPSDTIAQILERDPDWNALPDATPPAIRRLLQRCLKKDPKQRLRDIGDAFIDLEDAGPGAHVVASDKRHGRATAQWIVVAAGVVATIAAIVTFGPLREPVSRRPVRLSVVAPPGTAFSQRDITEHPQFALSPDGSRLVFVAAAPGGRARLWVRSLESGTAQPLAGSDDASGPFWSPDGREIAFQARGKLKKIAVDGGATQDLENVAFDVSQGAWSEEGVILFSRGNGGALFQVSANGGAATPATRLDSGRHETAHRWPQFLPDGRRFIVFVGSTTPADAGVYISSLDSTQTIRLLQSASNAVFAPPDSLLFEQNGTITRQAIDPRTGTLTGQPASLGDPIVGLRGPAYLPLSAARNGTIAYWTQRLTPSELLWFDRTGRPLGRVGGTANRYDNPVLSRDGTKILAALRENANSNEIWRFDLASGGASRLTFTRGVARFPIWSPNGQNIAFSAFEEDGARIIQKAASGAGQETRIEGPGRHWAIFPEDWSHDGQWLVYVVSSETAFDAWALNLKDRKAQPVLQSPANEVQPRLAPNGRWMAYASDETGTWEVYVQGFSGTSGKWQISTAGGSQPMWRDDGRELFYVGPDGRLFAVTVSAGETFEFQPPQPLFQTTLPSMLAPFRTGYAVSADGQRFLLNSLKSNPDTPAIKIVLNWDADIER
jgi:Tol biopolymer transport system component